MIQRNWTGLWKMKTKPNPKNNCYRYRKINWYHRLPFFCTKMTEKCQLEVHHESLETFFAVFICKFRRLILENGRDCWLATTALNTCKFDSNHALQKCNAPFVPYLLPLVLFTINMGSTVWMWSLVKVSLFNDYHLKYYLKTK